MPRHPCPGGLNLPNAALSSPAIIALSIALISDAAFSESLGGEKKVLIPAIIPLLVAGCGGGAGTAVSFGPGGAEFITFGVPLPGPALTAGTASVEGLPLAPAAAAEALAALGLSDVVALSILRTSA